MLYPDICGEIAMRALAFGQRIWRDALVLQCKLLAEVGPEPKCTRAAEGKPPRHGAHFIAPPHDFTVGLPLFHGDACSYPTHLGVKQPNCANLRSLG
jgi:hypothetical protein